MDLDTDFPDEADKIKFETDFSFDPFHGRQEETIALMNWAAENPFILGVELSSGNTVVTVPPYEGDTDNDFDNVYFHLAKILAEPNRYVIHNIHAY